MERPTTGANGSGMPNRNEDANILAFTPKQIVAKNAECDEAERLWRDFLTAHRASFEVGSVNAMRKSIAAYDAFAKAFGEL